MIGTQEFRKSVQFGLQRERRRAAEEQANDEQPR
jgi:hypothetical protein